MQRVQAFTSLSLAAPILSSWIPSSAQAGQPSITRFGRKRAIGMSDGNIPLSAASDARLQISSG
jgi:hypothetical protein